jgi:hypothetical protein
MTQELVYLQLVAHYYLQIIQIICELFENQRVKKNACHIRQNPTQSSNSKIHSKFKCQSHAPILSPKLIANNIDSLI